MLILNDQEALRKISEPVLPEDDLGDLMFEMNAFLENAQCSGVAAIQFGVPKRLFIIKNRLKIDNGFTPVNGPHEIVVFKNPVLKEGMDPRLLKGEGCMSFPGQYRTTMRYAMVKISDENNGIRIFSGWESAVIQHEMDHLEGILMFDREYKGYRKDPKKDIGRNEPCPCGSGKKYKRCCGR